MRRLDLFLHVHVRTLGGNPFIVSGPTIGRESSLVDAGLSVKWNPRLSTHVFYGDPLLCKNYGSHNSFTGIPSRA